MKRLSHEYGRNAFSLTHKVLIRNSIASGEYCTALLVFVCLFCSCFRLFFFSSLTSCGKPMNPIKSGFCARYLKAIEIKNLANISPFSKDRCPMKNVTIVLDSGPLTRCLHFGFLLLLLLWFWLKWWLLLVLLSSFFLFFNAHAFFLEGVRFEFCFMFLTLIQWSCKERIT